MVAELNAGVMVLAVVAIGAKAGACSSRRWTAEDAARERKLQLEWLRKRVVFKPSDIDLAASEEASHSTDLEDGISRSKDGES